MEEYHSRIVPEAQTERRSSNARRILADVVETVVLSLALFLVINVVSARIRVESISMVPTLNPGSFVIVNKLAYQLGEPSRGDIIVFRLPQDESQRYIKRIIGLPGDEVDIHDGQVWVDGELLVEPYMQAPTNRGGTWSVPNDAYFVLGDNRNNSSDSRVWGTVPGRNVIGKAILIYWPPGEWGILGHAAFAAGSH